MKIKLTLALFLFTGFFSQLSSQANAFKTLIKRSSVKNSDLSGQLAKTLPEMSEKNTSYIDAKSLNF